MCQSELIIQPLGGALPQLLIFHFLHSDQRLREELELRLYISFLQGTECSRDAK